MTTPVFVDASAEPQGSVKSEESPASGLSEASPASGQSDPSPPSVQPVASGLVMPTFDGTGSLRRFLDDFTRYARLQKWTADQTLNVFPLTLTSVARDAFDSLSAHQISTFQGASDGLKDIFVTKTVTEQHLDLRELKFSPDENLDTFVIRFRKVLTLAFPTVTDTAPLMFSHFLATLPAELHAAVIADGISTFDGAVCKVRNMIASQTYLRHAHPHVVRQLDSDGELARLASRVADLEAAARSAAHPRSSAERRPAQSSGSRLCYCCGGRNHTREYCRLKSRTCFKCHSVGHLAVMCPQSPHLQGNVRGSGRREMAPPQGVPPPSDRTIQTLMPPSRMQM